MTRHKFFLRRPNMLWHALLLVARLQRVKNGAGLQDDRKLPPPQNVALHLTTERCSKNGGDATSAAVEAEAAARRRRRHRPQQHCVAADHADGPRARALVVRRTCGRAVATTRERLSCARGARGRL